jgi:hypothetical protein
VGSSTLPDRNETLRALCSRVFHSSRLQSFLIVCPDFEAMAIAA